MCLCPLSKAWLLSGYWFIVKTMRCHSFKVFQNFKTLRTNQEKPHDNLKIHISKIKTRFKTQNLSKMLNTIGQYTANFLHW